MKSTKLRSLVTIPNILLILFGGAALFVYRLSLRTTDVQAIGWFLKLAAVQCVVYLLATIVTLKSRGSRSLLILTFVFAAAFRLSILFAPPYLSDDLYRYVWDGRVQAAGINPYRYIPADPALAHLRDDKIYPLINRRDYAPTMYPPVAEALFFLTTRVSESVTWMKTTMLVFETLAVWAITQLLVASGLPRQRVLIYAWHPLTVWEFAGSGHLDAIVVAFITLALVARYRKHEVATGVTVACAALVKIFPIVLLPALFRRVRWKMLVAAALTIVVSYLPYLGVGSRRALGFLFGYAQERGMESGEHFFLLSAVRRLFVGLFVPTWAYVAVSALLCVALVIWLLRQQHRETDYIKNALVIATVFTTLLSPHFAWYFIWLIPFLCFIPSLPVLYLTLSSFVLYLSWLYWTEDQVFKIKAAMYVPFFLMLAIFWSVRRWRHPNAEMAKA